MQPPRALAGEVRQLAARVLETAGREQLDALVDLLSAARDDALVERARKHLRA